MGEENKVESVINSGSSAGNAKPEINLSDYVSKTEYELLEKKLGENSGELGDLRKSKEEYNQFLEEMKPLFDKLQDNPEVMDAILAGKIDSDLAQAVMEGKVKLEDATIVAQANTQVKEELGKKEYDKLSTDDITKLIEKKLSESLNPYLEKLNKSEKNLNKTLEKAEETRKFTNKIDEFIANTPDYPDYAEEIGKWFDEHDNIYDIDVAYYAVKGKKTTADAKKEAEAKAAEEAKKIASNAGGGGSQGSSSISDPDYIDKIFGSYRNPNS
jgi:hypothetical protein